MPCSHYQPSPNGEVDCQLAQSNHLAPSLATTAKAPAKCLLSFALNSATTSRNLATTSQNFATTTLRLATTMLCFALVGNCGSSILM